jgi:hypothetical protein
VITTAPAPPGVPGQEPSGGPGPVLRAEPGDTLIIDGAGVARTGIIIAVPGRNGRPPYLVHWTAGDYDARVSPGAGARVEKRW